MVQSKQKAAPRREVWRWRDVRPWIVALLLAHLIFVATALELRVEHVVVDALVLILAFANSRTRQILVYLLPFWLTGFLYESIHLLTPLRGAIHIADFYRAEVSLFGVASQGVTLAEWFLAHTSPAADVVTGLAYMLYLLEPPLLVILLLVSRRDGDRARLLAWSFLAVNVMGLLTQIAFPVAPPWYVIEHGLGPAVLDAAPSAAGAARFDAVTGLGYFASFYSRNANVFGAFPSLHSAYPLLGALTVGAVGKRWLVPTAAFALLVAFSAIYLQHHYVLDVLGGWLFAGVAFVAVRRVLTRRARHVEAPEPSPHLEAAR